MIYALCVLGYLACGVLFLAALMRVDVESRELPLAALLLLVWPVALILVLVGVLLACAVSVAKRIARV